MIRAPWFVTFGGTEVFMSVPMTFYSRVESLDPCWKRHSDKTPLHAGLRLLGHDPNRCTIQSAE